MIVTKTELWAALPVVMFPFIPGDIVKCLVASWLATKIKIQHVIMKRGIPWGASFVHFVIGAYMSVYIQGGLRSPIGVLNGQYKNTRPEILGCTID